MIVIAATPEEMAVELRAEPRLRHYGASEHRCSERSWNVLVLRSQGIAYTDIAARFGISHSRAHRIVTEHVSDRLARMWDDFAAFGARTPPEKPA